VQDRKEADLCPQVLRVSSDRLQGFRRGLEENVIDHLLVLVGNRSDLFRHSEDDVKIGNIKEFRLPLLDPLRSRQALAFGAVSIPAAIEGVAFMPH
jgi:GTPase SAR1 family protein